MNSLRLTSVFCLLLFIFLSPTSGDESRYQDPAAVEEAATLMFSLPTPAPPTTYWNKIKAKISQGQAYFFPSNREGRKEVEVDGSIGGGGGGAGEKVKAAAAKSFETVEESVQSAARLAGDAVHKTAETVKNTFSGTERVVPNEAEL